MTDKEVLNAVIQKAEKNSWNQNQEALNLFHLISESVKTEAHGIHIDPEHFYLSVYLNYVIFDHDFAKALWRDSEWDWQHHLQQLVIAENRIEYLKQFIDEN